MAKVQVGISMLNGAQKNSNAEAAHVEPLQKLRAEVAKLLPGKDAVVDTALCTIISSGHLLLEDVPGVGKTTFIKGLAQLVGLAVARVQFTSDLLPADIVGVEVYNSTANTFDFHRGPIFTHVLIADELNRASPRTQSALLEAMGEGKVTVDRMTYDLPRPFTVFASQNPSASSIGTYEIPESQLDRFSAKIEIGYPAATSERQILQAAVIDPLAGVPHGVISIEQLLQLQGQLDSVRVSDPLIDYAKRFIDATRAHPDLKLGVSTRGGVIWVRMAKALALLEGRNYVVPDDLQAMAIPCLAHRIVGRDGPGAGSVVETLLSQVRV